MLFFFAVDIIRLVGNLIINHKNMTEKFGQKQEAWVRPPVTAENSKENLIMGIERVKEIIGKLKGSVVAIGENHVEYDDQITVRYCPSDEFSKNELVLAYLGDECIASSFHYIDEKEDYYDLFSTLDVSKDDWHIFMGETELLLGQNYKDRGVLKPEDRKISKEEARKILEAWEWVDQDEKDYQNGMLS